MSRLPHGFTAMMDASCSVHGGAVQSGLRMLDGTDGPARLVFDSATSWRHAARLHRWLAIVGAERPADDAFRVMWLLDGSSVRWSGGRPPRDLELGVTGLGPERAPILWFLANDADEGRRGLTAWGVFGAAGIVDGARVDVAARRLRGRVRLRTSIDTAMWGLSAAWDGRLTITAAGVPRPVEPQVVVSWR